MTIKEKTFEDLSKKEFQIVDGNWKIDIDKPTICVLSVSWIETNIDYNFLAASHQDWDVLKIDCSDNEKLIAEYGLSSFPSYVCLATNKAPKLISAHISEKDLISFFEFYLH